MKKYLWIVILLVSVFFSPSQSFALNAETRLKYQGLCEQNPNPHHVWDDAATMCVCAKPYIQDDMESWACISQEEYTRKHTWSGSGSSNTKPSTNTVTADTKSTSDNRTASSTTATSSSDKVVSGFDRITISADNYSDLSGDGEVSITSNKTLNNIKDGATEAVFQEKLQAWQQSINTAEQSGQFKDESSKQEFLQKVQEEKDLKTQIATAIKLVGFNHLRVLESTNKEFKFDFQSAEYKAYWKNPVDNNPFDDTTSATTFNKVSKNASAYSAQVRTLEDTLKAKYPSDWKVKYLVVPPKPVRPDPNQTSLSPYN